MAVPRWARYAVLAAAAVMLAACSGNAATGSGSNSGSGGGSNGGSTAKASGPVQVALILKDFTNPYFISMENSAKADASKLGVKLSVSAGSTDGDTTTQIQAIDNAIAAGYAGIIITPNGNAVNPALDQAKSHHLLVIALDTVPTPPSTADLTYATDNFEAGQLIGQYTAKRLAGKPADIAMLDLFNNQVVSVDTSRDHGFLTGMGIPVGNQGLNGQEPTSGHYKGQMGGSGTYKIACQLPTQGAVPGGQTAMEQCLSKDPNINVVYAINEPAAEGAGAALKAAHKTGVIVAAIDGGCAVIPYLQSGEVTATSGQFPGKMAALGVSAVYTLAKTGKKPAATPGLGYFNTGTQLFTDSPVTGVPSGSTSQLSGVCWKA
ncbi:MAG: substrate-binding domain-containing protein [Streptosporangiaceae bacterium]|nr:substrate-binding domain-containing protein [Streptosporangiaceae bacterium]MBV9856303.1 substrate-binding domain-containing protein [Streptosporangiaceae bacterium]